MSVIERRDYESMTDNEVNKLARHGDASAELESRSRTFRTTQTTVYVCLRCGEDIGRDIEQVRRDTGEPWADPFKPSSVRAWHESMHRCARRHLIRRGIRTTAITVKTPS